MSYPPAATKIEIALRDLKAGTITPEAALCAVLDDPNVLTEFLVEPEICDFFLREDVFPRLMACITPSEQLAIHDTSDVAAKRRGFVVSELFTGKRDNVPCMRLIAGAFERKADAVHRLLSLVNYTSNVGLEKPWLTAYFRKVIMSICLNQRPAFVKFLADHNYIESFVKNIGILAIYDTLVFAGWDDQKKTGSCEFDLTWLSSQKLMQRLVDCITPSQDDETISNAARAICDIVVKTAGNGGNNSLLKDVTSKPVLDQLVATLKKANDEKQAIHRSSRLYCFNSCVNIFVVLIQQYVNACERAALGNAGPTQVLGVVPEVKDIRTVPLLDAVLAIIPEVVKFNGRLRCVPWFAGIDRLAASPTAPPAAAGATKQTADTYNIFAPALPTTYGKLRPPLGQSFMKLVELTLVVCRSNSSELRSALLTTGALQLCLYQFFEYPFHNMLHGLVERIVLTVCNGHDPNLKVPIVAFFLPKCLLTYREQTKVNDEAAKRGEPALRFGYMGHILRICAALQSPESSIYSLISRAKARPDAKSPAASKVEFVAEWDSFVANELQAELAKANLLLGGVREPLFSNSGKAGDGSATVTAVPAAGSGTPAPDSKSSATVTETKTASGGGLSASATVPSSFGRDSKDPSDSSAAVDSPVGTVCQDCIEIDGGASDAVYQSCPACSNRCFCHFHGSQHEKTFSSHKLLIVKQPKKPKVYSQTVAAPLYQAAAAARNGNVTRVAAAAAAAPNLDEKHAEPTPAPAAAAAVVAAPKVAVLTPPVLVPGALAPPVTPVTPAGSSSVSVSASVSVESNLPPGAAKPYHYL